MAKKAKKKRIQCKSKAKTTGKRCKKAVVPGYEVCNTHGGKTPKGWDSPHTKHGRYIPDVPERLGDRFEAAIDDPDVENLSAEIALVDTRIGEMLSKLDNEKYGSIWNDLTKAALNIRLAMHSDKPTALIESFNNLEFIIENANEEQETWDYIMKYTEQRRRLVESMHKINTSADNILTLDQFMLSVGRVLAIVASHTKDKQQLANINNEIKEFVYAE